MKKNLKIPGVMAGLVMAAVIATVPAHAGEFSDGNEFATGEEFTDAIQGNVDAAQDVVSAEESMGNVFSEEVYAGGVVGSLTKDNVTWTMDEGGTLTVTGSGENCYAKVSTVDFDDFEKAGINVMKVRNIVIGEGIIRCGSMELFRFVETFKVSGNCKTVGGGVLKNDYNNLTTVILEEGVEEIGWDSFSNCPNLTNVNLPSSITEFGTNIFRNTPWGETKKMFVKNGVLLQWIASGTEAAVPEGITQIGTSAFVNTNVETVSLPSSLKKIGNYAFSSSKLKELVIPNSVEEIGQYAFENCKSLISVKLSSQLKKITYGIFNDCSSLVSINIPESVELIDNKAFSGCESLADIEIAKWNEFFDIERFKDTAWFKNQGNLIIAGDVLLLYRGEESEITIPQNVVEIKKEVFKNHTELEKVVLDGCTLKIDDRAFQNCSGLKTIEGNAKITSIEENAFSECSNLKSIVGTEKLVHIGEEAFYQCEQLTDMSNSEVLTDIGDNAFYGCTAFKGFVFTENLRTLGDEAFAGCKSLENIVFPESLEEIGDRVFENAAVQKLTFLCEYKKGMFEGGTTKELIVTKGDFGEIKEGYSMIGSDFVEMKELEKVTIGPEVTLIGQEVFDGCENLSEVNIEEGKVERIGEAAFRGCKALKEIVLPAKITSIGAGIFANSGIAKVTMDGVTEIPSAALAGCKNLTSFSFDNIKSIGRGSFRDCENLKEVIIPENVEEIQYEYEDSPFENCGAERVVIKNELMSTECFDGEVKLKEIVAEAGVVEGSFPNLETLVIGEKVSVIGRIEAENLKSLQLGGNKDTNMEWAGFSDIKSLEKVVISGSVEITEAMFENCENLTSVTITGEVSRIGAWAFAGTGLTELEIPESVTELGDSFIFGTKPEKLVLGADVTYDSMTFNGVDFTDLQELQILSGEISESLFECERFEKDLKLKIGPNVTSIGRRAFFECKQLVSVEFEEGKLETIGDGAFVHCTSLTKVDIPACVKEIGEMAFSDTGIKSVSFKEGLKRIGKAAFATCPYLREASIPKSVESIGDYAFGIRAYTAQVGNEKPYTAYEPYEEGFTIIGYGDTEAERYAEDTPGITFVDLDGNSKKSLKTATVSGLSAKYYTGKSLKPSVTVTLKGKKLVLNKDYKVTYKNNTNIGQAIVTITGIGKYTGSISRNFTIRIKNNSTYTAGKLKYTITNADTTGKGTVTLTAATNKTTVTSLTVPSIVKIGGKSFKVTAIGKKAFSGAKKLKKVVIGKYVTYIGKEAFSGNTALTTVSCSCTSLNYIGKKVFYGDKKLSSVTLKTTKLTSSKTGSDAFKNIKSTCKFKVPASKVKTYQKLLISRGAGSKIKVTK